MGKPNLLLLLFLLLLCVLVSMSGLAEGKPKQKVFLQDVPHFELDARIRAREETKGCMDCYGDILAAIADCQAEDVDLLLCITDILGAGSDCLECICIILDLLGGFDGICNKQ